ncbi:MAG: hypothetical protein K8T91_28125 [Planctomycetes bacterium]|nr:hypothetical protein [Planctomycetota bacterium]
MRPFAISVISLLGFWNCCAVADEPKHPIGVITMQTDPPSSGSLLVCIEGTPYFQTVRKRHADDQPVKWPWKSKEECRHFEMTSSISTTSLKNLGPGGLNVEGKKFIPKDDWVKLDVAQIGYLTADHSTNPPSIKLEKDAGKFSTWKLHPDETKRLWYIENENDSGKPAWLSKSRDTQAVMALGNQGAHVVEYRRATLSNEVKPSFRIGIANDER